MKKYTVIIIMVVILVLGFLTGMYLYKINKMYIAQNKIENNSEMVKKNITQKEERDKLSVSNVKEKTSPNCTIILKVYYEVCNHLIETRKNIEAAQVNMTEEELKEMFKDWELQKFTRYRNSVI